MKRLLIALLACISFVYAEDRIIRYDELTEQDIQEIKYWGFDDIILEFNTDQEIPLELWLMGDVVEVESLHCNAEPLFFPLDTFYVKVQYNRLYYSFDLEEWHRMRFTIDAEFRFEVSYYNGVSLRLCGNLDLNQDCL